ncbi:hypothetical protein [Hydrogenophaga sp. RAC07]|uniref:hypothetical protein n=1 Tax=Hydrogenophaga sp. RAC07 TaxID=1842537 RepID=UPI001C12CC4D|nr:hypothetical protein [Hydrogenophaga sp. RAC07]
MDQTLLDQPTTDTACSEALRKKNVLQLHHDAWIVAARPAGSGAFNDNRLVSETPYLSHVE